MTNEEIQQNAEAPLDKLDEQANEFFQVLEAICTGESGIGELDDAYKALKSTSKELNKLAKAWRKNNPEKEIGEIAQERYENGEFVEADLDEI